jgi:hypothetical protein
MSLREDREGGTLGARVDPDGNRVARTRAIGRVKPEEKAAIWAKRRIDAAIRIRSAGREVVAQARRVGATKLAGLYYTIQICVAGAGAVVAPAGDSVKTILSPIHGAVSDAVGARVRQASEVAEG